MTEITFNDILIEPQYSEVVSRSDVNLDFYVGTSKLELPVISANMKHITGPKMAQEMRKDGGLGVLHRFNSIEGAVNDFKECFDAGVSIGVKDGDKERFDELYKVGAKIFVIDIAHGHSLMMKNMIEWIKKKGLKDIHIIAGNIATKEAAEDLQEWGADMLKVGIGPGAVCVTRRNTGVGVPQFSAIKEVAEVSKVPFISDGGVKSAGDIAKALIFADMVMIGGFIAGTSETPGNVFRNEDGQFYKVYGGSASGENKKDNRFVEGIMKTVPFQGHVKHILREIKHGLQSAFSYTGAHNLKEFHSNVKWRVISSGGKSESKI